MMGIERLEESISEVRTRISLACDRSGRPSHEVRLIGVTKLVAAETIAAAAQAGLTEFGENYVQELVEKRHAAPHATWHFIGRLQRNKVRRILQAADLVQTLEPGRAAERMAELAHDRGRPADCLVEVDYTGRRVGVSPEEVEAFVGRVSGWPGLRLRGLMTVPPLGRDPKPLFGRLRDLRDRVREHSPEITELSMGMSADYEAAVEEGATMVRVGTAIFGPRP